MNSSVLLLAVSLMSAESVSSKDLFARLDRNQDGSVTRDELNASQLPLFKRALRVADRNEDGALDAAEFAQAVSDPKPIELPGTNAAARIGSFDFKTLDRNGDGSISLDEVPDPMKERFEQLLDRIGQKSVPVDRIQGYLRGDRPADEESDKDEMKSESKDAMAEMKAGVPEIKPRPSDLSSNGKNRPAGDAMMGNLFSQLDRNADGKLTGDEVPRRMQENMKLADGNKDGSISKSEFEEGLRRRMQNQKK